MKFITYQKTHMLWAPPHLNMDLHKSLRIKRTPQNSGKHNLTIYL
jgi:hypothetical protein